MIKHVFTIGCDPEFFLRAKKSGKLISAIPFVDGTKDCPKQLPKGGNIQRDNVAVEIATDPANSRDMFVTNIQNTLSEAVKTLPLDTEMVILPSANFDEKELQHPEAQRFGCDPDYCAWEVRMNEPPFIEDATFRSTGAHIHVGTTGEDENAFLLDFQGKLDTVRLMDCFHGIISTVLDSTKESIDRRKLYGRPGAHRPKDYGVEYRVLSPYWLKSPITVMLMYHLTADVLKIMRDGLAYNVISTLGEEEVKNTIMNGDTKAALKMVDTVLMGHMSEDSIHYYYEAIAKLEDLSLDFNKEWELYKEV